jgi:hypothetical protein
MSEADDCGGYVVVDAGSLRYGRHHDHVEQIDRSFLTISNFELRVVLKKSNLTRGVRRGIVAPVMVTGTRRIATVRPATLTTQSM